MQPPPAPANGWKQVLFPEPSRSFPFRRSLRLGLRTAHILTSGTVVGGVIFAQPWSALEPWWIAMLVTGLCLLATDLHATMLVMFQVSGVVVLSKLALAALAGWYPQFALPLLLLALVIGSISSHMPGRYRHHILWRGNFLGEERRRR